MKDSVVREFRKMQMSQVSRARIVIRIEDALHDGMLASVLIGVLQLLAYEQAPVDEEQSRGVEEFWRLEADGVLLVKARREVSL